MQKIQQLSLQEAQKIAAGEVVDRPANIVKELIENAIDAGSTKIELHIKNGGKDLIHIVDDGCGMSKADALLCFKQYATSKISTICQLETINTFGFRGEALACITAVSKVEIKTCDGKESTKLIVENSKLIEHEQGNTFCGTEIKITNLFKTVPARQKFLKKKETEFRKIMHIIHAFCLDYKNVSFTVYNDEKKVVHCPATNNLINRMSQLWGHNFSKHMVMLPPADETKKINITGAISNQQYFRYDRSSLFFFINKRWIKNIQLSRALTKAYLNIIPPSRFPAGCIFIELDPKEVDINVHPKKEEVEFLHPVTITNQLRALVTQTLENHLSEQTKKTIYGPTKKEAQSFNVPQLQNLNHLYVPLKNIENTRTFAPTFAPQPTFKAEQKPVAQNMVKEENIIEKQKNIIERNNITARPQEFYKIIGQYNKTYILIEKEDGLFFVDQHAAHERILYEKFANNFKNIATVKLLFPQIIRLKADELVLIQEHKSLFIDNGIEFEPFGPNQIVIQSTPVHIKNINFTELLQQTISWIKELSAVDQKDFTKAINEKLHAQMSCKAAVKAGDILTQEKMQQLLTDLNKTANRIACPHGRPTGWMLSLSEIEKKFKRDYK